MNSKSLVICFVWNHQYIEKLAKTALQLSFSRPLFVREYVLFTAPYCQTPSTHNSNWFLYTTFPIPCMCQRALQCIITPVIGFCIISALTVHSLHSLESIPGKWFNRSAHANSTTITSYWVVIYTPRYMELDQQFGQNISLKDKSNLLIRAELFWLFPKTVNQPPKPVGFRLTIIQLSDIFFS